MRVLWTVTDFVLLPGAQWTCDQARAMLFKPLDMDETTITFNHQVCREVRFDRKTMRLAQYLSQKYTISPADLGLADEQVEVVATSCRISGLSEFLRLADKRLLIHMHGVFFFLEPTVLY